VSFTADATVSEDAAISGTAPPATVLTINVGAIASENEVITVACEHNENVAFVDSAPITIDSSGVRGGRTGFEVFGAWDAQQLVSRPTTIHCSVKSTVVAKPPAELSIALTVLGVAQPSVAFFCPHNMSFSPLEVGIGTLTACLPTLTTNGDARVIAIGGNCATCPVPAFGVGTVVTINGIALVTSVSADGSRIEFVTPTIAAMEAQGGFTLGRYYNLVITTPAGALGALAGTLVLGPDGTEHGLVRCGTAEGHALCPPSTAATSGAYYTDRCLAFPDPTVSNAWTVTGAAHLFAYGTPPQCRPCPAGCRCPGGNRCRAMIGWYVADEDLGDAQGPMRCAAPAEQRCADYSATLGRTECGEGYAGLACGACKEGYFREHGVCQVCTASGLFDAVAVPLAWNAGCGSLLYPFVVSAKFIALFISLLAGRSGGAVDDLSTVKQLLKENAKELLQEAALQSAKFLMHMLVSVQLIATVNVAATPISNSNVLRVTSDALGIFLFQMPLVHPECVSKASGAALDFAAQSAILGGGLLFVLLDVGVAVLPVLRPEHLCCGWRCCGRRINSVRVFTRTHITPFLRYGISAVLSLGYGLFVVTALEMIVCEPSAVLDGALGLVSNPTVACFTGSHTSIFILALVVYVLVGIVWPFVSAGVIVRFFVCRPTYTVPSPEFCGKLCVAAADIHGCEAEGAAHITESGGGGINTDGATVTFDRDAAAVSIASQPRDAAAGRLGSAAPPGEVDAVSDDGAVDDVTARGINAKLGVVVAITEDTDSDATAQECAVDILVELGCRCWPNRRATRVRKRALALGARTRAFATSLDTPVEPQFFWLIRLRMYAMLLIASANAMFVSAAPSLGSAVALFVITLAVMTALTVITVAQCPYHRSDRWNVALSIGVLVLTSLSAVVNFSISLHELRLAGAEGVIDIGATLSAVALGIMLITVFIAFLLSRSLGICIRCACGRAFLRHCDTPSARLVPIQGEEAVEGDVELAMRYGDRSSKVENTNPLFEALNAGVVQQQQGVQTRTDDTTEADGADPRLKRKRAKTRFSKWRKRRANAPTLFEALFGDGEESDAAISAVHAALSAIFHKYSSETGGVMSSATAQRMLRVEATRTSLEGNFRAHSALLRIAMGDDTRVAQPAFLAALKITTRADPNGAVAEWLISELEKYEGEVAALAEVDAFDYLDPTTRTLERASRDELLRSGAAGDLTSDVWIQPASDVRTWRGLWYRLSDLVRACEGTAAGDAARPLCESFTDGV
jgi:hypothetical protein